MMLYQTTLFGVRGERFRIGKNSPFAREGETLNAQRSTLNAQVETGAENGECDGCLRAGVANCIACIEADAGRREVRCG